MAIREGFTEEPLVISAAWAVLLADFYSTENSEEPEKLEPPHVGSYLNREVLLGGLLVAEATQILDRAGENEFHGASASLRVVKMRVPG